MIYTRLQNYTNPVVGKHRIQTFEVVVVVVALVLLFCCCLMYLSIHVHIPY